MGLKNFFFNGNMSAIKNVTKKNLKNEKDEGNKPMTPHRKNVFFQDEKKMENENLKIYSYIISQINVPKTIYFTVLVLLLLFFKEKRF